jgi:hypothetical protein
MKFIFVPSLFVFICLSGCSKGDKPQNNQPVCGTITSVNASPGTITPYHGQKLIYSCVTVFSSGSTNSNNVTYTWIIPGETTRTNANDSIASIDYRHAGWWYVEAKNTCDGVVKKDSFLLKVNPPLGTAPCNSLLTNNVLMFTGEFTSQYAYAFVTQKDSMLNNSGIYYYGVHARTGLVYSPAHGQIYIVFHHSFNKNNIPPTGEYIPITSNNSNSPTLAFGAQDRNKCYLIYNGYNLIAGTHYYWPDSNQKVYVTNQNGKLRVTLCNFKLSGGLSSSFVTGAVLAP